MVLKNRFETDINRFVGFVFLILLAIKCSVAVSSGNFFFDGSSANVVALNATLLFFGIIYVVECVLLIAGHYSPLFWLATMILFAIAFRITPLPERIDPQMFQGWVNFVFFLSYAYLTAHAMWHGIIDFAEWWGSLLDRI